MTGKMQSQSVISKMWIRVVSAALALAMVLAFGVAMAPSAQAQTFKVLHKFHGRPTDGNAPAGGLAEFEGNLYGATIAGGPLNLGTIFVVDKSGNENVLYNFEVHGAGKPDSGLTADSVGNFYGVVSAGPHDFGEIYKINTTGVLTVIHRFKNQSDGEGPDGGLIRESAGNIYGATFNGGSISCGGNGCGTVFKLDTGRKVTVLHAFTGAPDGAYPSAGLVRDAMGNLYGTTSTGGNTNGTCAPEGGCGIVFKIDTTGKETVLYAFTGVPDGEFPVANLILDAVGNLYGTTATGGVVDGCTAKRGCGTVFKLDTTGKETVLYSFTSGTDGAIPNAGLVRDATGNLYGTTVYGGNTICTNSNPGCGTVFELDTAGKETILHRFVGTDGAFPVGDLIRDRDGVLYGTTSQGTGNAKHGVVFEIKITP
jgi:uncharacterized repeat protein (TIGR03803 family)